MQRDKARRAKLRIAVPCEHAKSCPCRITFLYIAKILDRERHCPRNLHGERSLVSLVAQRCSSRRVLRQSHSRLLRMLVSLRNGFIRGQVASKSYSYSSNLIKPSRPITVAFLFFPTFPTWRSNPSTRPCAHPFLCIQLRKDHNDFIQGTGSGRSNF
jgi:hypothetical protein